MPITSYKATYDQASQSYTLDRANPQVSYVGRVISVHRRDYRAMSDVYTVASFATVLNDKGEVEEVLVNANFECDVSGGHAEVDATPEVMAVVTMLQAEAKIAADERSRLDDERRAEDERNRPVVGKQMRVVKGRKVPVGTVGTVAFISAQTGSVLLKKDEEWQVRTANGVWVNPANLKAR